MNHPKRLAYLVDMTARLAFQTVFRLEFMDCSWFPVYDLYRFPVHRAYVCYVKSLLGIVYPSHN